MLLAVLTVVAVGWWAVRVYLDRQSQVLRWEDPTTCLTFIVTEEDGGFVHTWTRLHVATSDGHRKSEQLDDDAYFGKAALVRWQDWVLVLNDGFVIGGYNCSTKTLYGEYDWDELPFLHWRGEGELVASKQVREHGALPVNWGDSPSTQPTSSP